jgi:hypothetical protein
MEPEQSADFGEGQGIRNRLPRHNRSTERKSIKNAVPVKLFDRLEIQKLII